MPIAKYCQKCNKIEKQNLKWRLRNATFDVIKEYKQKRLYIRENRIFKGIAWYCPNCHHIDWDEEIDANNLKKTVIKHPSISYRAY